MDRRPSQDAAMIEVAGLCKSFWVHKKEPGLWGSVRSLIHRKKEEKRAVESVSFRVGEGEIVGLVGANGAGKTTLVKMLAGIVHPSSGTARVLGFEPWSRDDRLRRQMALIMGQKAQLWWDLPAADGFLLLRDIYGIPPQQMARDLDDLVQLLGVQDQVQVPIRRLSLGERMKMELIAALLHSPKVVYLDEPTIGLDLGAQRAVREFILSYRTRRRPAMLLTSHYMDDIERLCERMLILRDGRLVYDGSRRRVIERFARYKTVTVVLRRPWTDGDAEYLERLGRRLESDTSVLRLEVDRNQVASVAAALTARFDVADLSIEEEPLAHVIERLQRAKQEEEVERFLFDATAQAGFL